MEALSHCSIRLPPRKTTNNKLNATNTTAMQRIHGFIVACTLAFSAVAQADQPVSETQKSKQPNVLFIAIDDLNDWIGALGGHPQAKTPNLDRLISQSVLFTNAHCAAPVCNASRHSHFKRNGYKTLAAGKIFHKGTSDIKGYEYWDEERPKCKWPAELAAHGHG